MGWSYEKGQTRQGLIEELLHGVRSRGKLLDHRVVGSKLWTVEYYDNDGAPVRFIGLYLIQAERGFGYGYKAMTEAEGPCYYDCPLALLEASPVPAGGYSASWRLKVKAYHARAATVRALRVGDVVVLAQGCNPGRLIVDSVKPLSGHPEDGSGGRYSIPKKLIHGVEKAAGSF